MAKKYENYSVGDNLSKTSNAYSAWTNDLLRKLVAGKTVIQPGESTGCLLYTSPSPRDRTRSRMPSSA